MANKHIGSYFDDFLEEEGILAQTNAVALSRTTMNVSFLADQPQFIPTIAQWYFAEWGRLSPTLSFDDINQKVTLIAESRQALPLSFVLHDEDKPLAVAELKFHEHPDFPDYKHWLGGVFVPIEKRGQGYATMVLQQTLKHAQTQQIPSLYLQCEQHNIDLYLKHSFKVIHGMIDKGVAKALMVKEL